MRQRIGKPAAKYSERCPALGAPVLGRGALLWAAARLLSFLRATYPVPLNLGPANPNAAGSPIQRTAMDARCQYAIGSSLPKMECYVLGCALFRCGPATHE